MARKTFDPNDPVKPAGLLENITPEQEDELCKCADDFIYFATNWCMIQSVRDGAILFDPYPYQKEMLDSFIKHDKLIFMCGRQLGKTTLAALYILWWTIFQDDKTVLIASNTADASIEVVDRIKYAYEHLPFFMKPGVTIYNQKKIIFENKSKIVSRATTKKSGRGLSISLLYVDEMGMIDPPEKQREFWASIEPTTSSAGAKTIITSTPISDEDQFAQIWFSAKDIYDSHGNEDPEGIGKNGFKAIKFTWKDHPDRDEKWKERSIASIGNERFLREHACLVHNTVVTLMDQDGRVFDIRIGDLYDFLGK